ncbi:type II secretion system protein [Pedobacter sp. Leaf176]|uniref:type II secretion system protein n=1 Tax=Pedobacter sp. Leaf176 TaxID=1736286 RepID=UPI0006FF470F|nr:hypothetical protein [Pedobacter sp. Leaf176]KQR70895.1 hypothetical protein ASF92_05670 [Pedobacter sp. Leaf176]
MAELKKGKLEASTLIEVLIAMVIIMVLFALAIGLFNNVLSGGVSLKKLSVQNELNVLAKEVEAKGYIEKEVLLVDSVIYNFSRQETAHPGLSRLEIKAFRRAELLGSLKILYREKENEEKN